MVELMSVTELYAQLLRKVPKIWRVSSAEELFSVCSSGLRAGPRKPGKGTNEVVLVREQVEEETDILEMKMVITQGRKPQSESVEGLYGCDLKQRGY